MPNEPGTPKPTIAQHLRDCGVSRRNFLQLCTALMVTAPVGLALTEKGTALQIAQAIGKAKRPSVVWLHFQDCTGCSETLFADFAA
jgi:hydrogenase small subunit